MPNDQDDTRVSAKIVYPEPAPEDKIFYANVILVNHTPWDFALHFDRLTTPVKRPDNIEGQVEIEATKIATIYIPVTLVRGLIEALQTNLKGYENQYGKVTIPKRGKDKESHA